MLGIGFIIAHFVAMQKPQQRKYHSSCNRSVHRGTAHGKQEVKVCKRKTPHLLVRSFLSPYGDGTKWHIGNKRAVGFSPPYGDGHEWMRAKWSAPIRKYWKISEQMMVKYCDLIGHGLLKSELLYLQEFRSMEHFKLELIEYLDYYNNRRIKAKLKGLPPAIHRQQALSAA